ncbi:MAG: ATP-binding protein [Deltaproteobacteria bacterium]|jgi:hypothetical protein|nr:ATP-binding protein [Deltaproteobacteria bacterium]
METSPISLKEMPSGMDSFKEIIEGDYLYVDKTRHIFDLVRKGKNYFLSRPKRFGKSLLLSALKSFFSGPPDLNGHPAGLFQNLWIAKSGLVFPERHPIIYLSMASPGKNNDFLETTILDALNDINFLEDLGLKLTTLGSGFSRVIERLFLKYKKQVVILIDEYDAPVSEKIDNLPLAELNRDTLKDFYSGLKAVGDYTRFAFITGSTRYAFMGLSAGLNHLVDLTLIERHADICGFTHGELDTYFSPYFPGILEIMKKRGVLTQKSTVMDLRAKILNLYDGYTWDGDTKILNPYSLLNFIENAAFNPYWMQIGASNKFLNSVVSRNPLSFLKDKLQNLTPIDVGYAEVGSLAPAPALFQTGYLTIDSITFTDKSNLYKFKTPNEEIRTAFEKSFKDSLFGLLRKDPDGEGIKFKEILDSGDEAKLTALITSLYSSLPAKLHRAEESFYHSVLHAYCWGILDIPPLSELPGGEGTPDIIILFGDGLYVVIELKYQKPTDPLNPETDEEKLKDILGDLASKGLKAIDAKKYANPYLSRANKIIKIGLGVYHREDCLALVKIEDYKGHRAADPQ